MTIKKFLHSCILIEDNGKRLLIDPGSFSFIEKKLSPADIGPVDAILITHSHADHYYEEALKHFANAGCQRIVASGEICELLRKAELPFEVIKPEEEKEIAGFKVKAIPAVHGALPIAHPHNFGFLINQRFFHPGDSIEILTEVKCDVLALPVSAPWAKWIDLLEFGRGFNAKVIIPIHEKVYAEYFIPRVMQVSKEYLEKQGIEFKPLNIGDKLEI